MQKRNALPKLAVLFGAVMFLLFSNTVVSGQSLNSTKEDLALVGGTIYVNPTDEPIRDGVALIQGGKITAVGSRAQVQIPQSFRTIDCAGLTITAGFWNSHVHFFERKWANAATIPAPELGRQLSDMLTQYGFTSVFDIGSMWENTRRLRDRIDSGEVPGPKIRSTGEALLALGAPPNDIIVRMMGAMVVPNPEVANTEQATASARKFIASGVDAIKVHLQPPPPPLPPLADGAISAAVNEGHRAGKLVFVHPSNGADVLRAVRAGVDIVAHTTPYSGPWDETILAAMKERRVALTPTLTIWKYFARHDRVSAQEKIVQTELGQLRAWLAVGGTVLFGNDLGAVEYDPSDEYALMAEAGMNFRQILASLTTAPAERFGVSKQQGQIAAGFQADVVVLKGDPSKNARALTDVQFTLRAGKIIYRATE